MSIPKVIVSHGRAGQVLTLRWLPSAQLCVAESQAPLYREAHPDTELLVHPDTIVGLPPKRQWVHDTLGDCFQIDDDCEYMVSTTGAKGAKKLYPEGDWAADLIDRLADEARDACVYLFGFATVANPTAFDALRPYRMTGVVYGQAFGWLAGSRLFMSERVQTADDYWLSLLNAYYHRKILMDERWAIVTKAMFAGKDGWTLERTTAAEQADTAFLRATFGHHVVKTKRHNHKATLKHTAQRTIVLPYESIGKNPDA